MKEYLEKINSEIKSLVFGEPAELYDPIRYMMELGGKRLRPLLCLLSYNLFHKNWNAIIRSAIGLEVFHNFTLMHDDIMDKAPLRRGSQTIHEKWNSNIGILSGDVMLVKSYQLLSDVDSKFLPQVLQAFNRTATQVCEGQQIDMNFELQANVSENAYLEMIGKKTAELLGFSMELGAILANQQKVAIQNLYEFGRNLGLAFQLKDDLLDVYGDTNFGKRSGGDIISNKKTFLLIRALDKSSAEVKEELKKWIEKKEFDNQEKVNAVKSIYDSIGVEKDTQSIIDKYTDFATANIDRVAGDPEVKEMLLTILKDLKNRQS